MTQPCSAQNCCSVRIRSWKDSLGLSARAGPVAALAALALAGLAAFFCMGSRQMIGCGAHYTQTAPGVIWICGRNCLNFALHTHTICVGGILMRNMVRKKIFISPEQNRRLKARAAAVGRGHPPWYRACAGR